jgi:hypothetical protein
MSRDKKWSSNDKNQLLVENFRKFMEEGDFSPDEEVVNKIGELKQIGPAPVAIAMGAVIGLAEVVKLLVTTEGRRNLKQAIIFLPNLAEAICEMPNELGAESKITRLITSGASGLCNLSSTIFSPLTALHGMIEMLEKIPKAFDYLEKMVSGAWNKGSHEKIESPVSEGEEKITLSRSDVRLFLESGVTRENFKELQKDFDISVVSENRELNEAVPAVVTSAALSWLLDQLRSADGRAKLIEILEYIPKTINALCEIPEKMTNKAPRIIRFIGKMAAKGGCFGVKANPIYLTIAGVIKVLKMLSDDEADHLINIIESGSGGS